MTTDVSPVASTVLDGVRRVLVRTLALGDREDSIDAQTALLGELPELDSLAIVELVVALENHFGITLEDDDVTGEAFATVGTLAELVSRRRTDA
jgi:acyl carrier protein